MTQSLGTILLVCTSHADLGETGHKTGFWMEELTAPYYAFKDAGYDVQLASPAGGKPPVDAGSLSENMKGPSVARFDGDVDATAKLSTTTKLNDIDTLDAYAGIFLAGGHGTMWDFPKNANLGALLVSAVAEGKAIGAVCHGVAGLLAGGAPSALKGKSVAGFSNEEEGAVGLTEVVPFLLESKLIDAGLQYSSGAVFTPHVVTDGLLITGQNPVSSQATADAMIAAMADE